MIVIEYINKEDGFILILLHFRPLFLEINRLRIMLTLLIIKPLGEHMQIASYSKADVLASSRRVEKMLNPDVNVATSMGWLDRIIDHWFRADSKLAVLQSIHCIMHDGPKPADPESNMRHQHPDKPSLTFGKMTVFENLKNHLKDAKHVDRLQTKVDLETCIVSYCIKGQPIYRELLSETLRSAKKGDEDYFKNYGQEVLDYLRDNLQTINDERMLEGKKSIKMSDIGADELLDVSVRYFKTSREAKELTAFFAAHHITADHLSTTVFDDWTTDDSAEGLKKYTYTTFVSAYVISQRDDLEASTSIKNAALELCQSLLSSIRPSRDGESLFFEPKKEDNLSEFTESVSKFRRTLTSRRRPQHSDVSGSNLQTTLSIRK